MSLKVATHLFANKLLCTKSEESVFKEKNGDSQQNQVPHLTPVVGALTADHTEEPA